APLEGRPNPFSHPRSRRRNGAEPSGRNQWQPVANETPPKTAQTSRSATGGNPRQRFGAHGEEGRRFESEGLQNPRSRDFPFRTTCSSPQRAVVWKPLWSFRVEKALAGDVERNEINPAVLVRLRG